MSKAKFPTWALLLVLIPVGAIGAINMVAPEISEQTVFLPQPRAAHATTEGQLHDMWHANAKATNWKWPTAVTIPSPGVTRLVSTDPAATFLGQDALHGFVAYGTQKLAWSYFTKATPTKATDAQRPLIVECTGNAMDRYSAGVSYAQKALLWGDVLMFDYPGYGDSTGSPSPQSLEAMLDPVIAHARAVAGDRPLIFWGHSLGGFVCGKLASKVPETRALILETTARRAKDVVREWTPAAMRPFVFPKITPSFAAYDTAKAAGGGAFPVLVLGAGQDTTLPVGLSRSLADALKQQGAIVTYHEFPQALHWNVPKQSDFIAVMTAFFDTLRLNP
jgi:pimeloyl-ACP methyl ester carboxylesterase